MKSELANFVIFVVDAGIVVFLAICIYGIKQKRIFALGRWYFLSKEKLQYWQVVVGYALLFLVLLYFRVYVFPERLFKYL
jgi:hypothetical protein